jgi:carbonyl reductase 1
VSIYSFVARNEELGLKAVKQIQDSNNQAQDKLRFHQLDITNVESIRRLVDHIKEKYGGLDILINNAATAFKVI